MLVTLPGYSLCSYAIASQLILEYMGFIIAEGIGLRELGSISPGLRIAQKDTIPLSPKPENLNP